MKRKPSNTDIPLPEFAQEFRPRWPGDPGGFNESQLRAYAAAEVARAVAEERERWATELRAMPNGCALADNRAHVERFRSMALARLLEGPNMK